MITITTTAATKLSELVKEQENPGTRLRLFVTRGGCHGFSYGMAFDRERRDGDEVVAQDGVEVLVDPLTSKVMSGAQIGSGFGVGRRCRPGFSEERYANAVLYNANSLPHARSASALL